MKTLILLFALILLHGCTDATMDISKTTPPDKGTYTGTFAFTEGGMTSSGGVTFLFTDTSYTCVPEKPFLPPAGGGAYSVEKNIITLTDHAPHTANFDWTLILNGDFEFTSEGTALTLTQADAQHNRFRKIEMKKSGP
jgi:hypothetical protein